MNKLKKMSVSTITKDAELTCYASLMSSILENAGHLGEHLTHNGIKYKGFVDCVQYVVYHFFNSNTDSHIVRDVTKCSLKHQRSLNSNGRHSPELSEPEWIDELDMSDIEAGMYYVRKQWNKWSPDEEIVMLIKQSVDKQIK